MSNLGQTLVSLYCLLLVIFLLHLVTCTVIAIFVLSTAIEVEDFVEASAQLLQPLEDFFNNVFVMVVCSFNSFYCWTRKTRLLVMCSLLFEPHEKVFFGVF